jgi:hypothetical protein
VPDPPFEVTDDLFLSTVQVLMRTPEEGEYAVPTKVHEVRLEDAGDGKLAPVLEGEVRIGKNVLPSPGLWHMIAVVTVVGFNAVGKVRGKKTAAPIKLRVGEKLQIRRKRRLPVETPSMKGKIARRVPGLARVVKRAKEGRRASGVR